MRPSEWQPSASVEALQFGAQLRTEVRRWMAGKNILEVVTPVFSSAGVTDPQIESFRVGSDTTTATAYLQTSPEYPMKRLLAAYRCDIYQLAPVFRAGESGRYHNPEFTLLEWYRVGIDHQQLMTELAQLLHLLAAAFKLQWQADEYVAYWDVAESLLQAPASSISAKSVAHYFAERGRSWPQAMDDDLDAALDLLMDEFWLPTLPDDRITFLVDYPASQAALARKSVDVSGRAVAARFEVYVGKVELANGFYELTDAAEQLARFEADNHQRQRRHQQPMPLDKRMIAALEHGLPDCAGVAVGIERLLMVLTGTNHINDVLAFDFSRV